MQMLRAGQVNQETEHNEHMHPPGDAVGHNIERRSGLAEPWADQSADRRAINSPAGGVGKSLDESQRKDDEEDQAEDDKAVPGTMQEAFELPGSNNRPAHGEDHQRNQNQGNKDIQQSREGWIASQQRQRAVEGPKHQVEQAELNDNEA